MVAINSSTVIVLALIVNLIDSMSVRVVELNKDWVLKNQNETIEKKNVMLPSGVYSEIDLSDPEKVLQSYNDIRLKWVSYDNWTYIKEFTSPQDYQNIKFINLTFHGIDTVSEITLNGKVLGKTDNMFVRYSFNIKDLLRQNETNRLEVAIVSPIYAAKRLAESNAHTPPDCPPERYHGECHVNLLRKMQASFSWDWGLGAPSMGIWRPVTLEIHDVAIIRDVDVVITKNNSGWELYIKVFLETGLKNPIYGQLTMYAVGLLVDPVQKNFTDKPISTSNPIATLRKFIPDRDVKLWWPNGFGEQKLYHLHFTWKGFSSSSLLSQNPRELSISQKSIRIGFRTIELVQDSINNNNNTGFQFYFRVNGIPIFMKGSNYIPSHVLPELGQDQGRIKHLLESAKDANMNMLRLWGGGVYESDYFYDTADYLGILIWHDLMFACAMYPVFPKFLQSVQKEINQNVKRIAFHPSVAIWAANNENEVALAQNWYGTNKEYQRFADEYIQLYVDTIYQELDVVLYSSRPKPLVSSPSNGRKSKDDNYLSKNPQDPNYGDIHFYDYLSDGWNPKIYQKPRFASEYGFQSIPSLTAWKRTMSKDDTNMDNLIDHRQHHPLGHVPIVGLILRHLPLPPKDSDNYLEAFIYFSQISQAMATKTETEVYRSLRNTSHNTMGALYWQLNDVWIAPSWSSIDFEGNYKILHYWAKEFFSPITIIAHSDTKDKNLINIFVVRDTISPAYSLILSITMKVYLWSELFPSKVLNWSIMIEPNTAKHTNILQLNDILVKPLNSNNCFFEFLLETENKNFLSKTYYFPDFVKKATGIKDPQIDIEITSTYCKKPINSVSIAIKITAPAIFVDLQVEHENITLYKLSKNGFIQVEPIQIVHLEFTSNNCENIQPNHIKIYTVNKYMRT